MSKIGYRILAAAVPAILLGMLLAFHVKDTASATIPGYYKATSVPNVYSYEDIRGGGSASNGINETLYRKLVGTDLYECDAAGTVTGTTPVVLSDERPQPSIDAQVDITYTNQTMVEYSELGFYRMNYAGSTNLGDTYYGTGYFNNLIFNEPYPGTVITPTLSPLGWNYYSNTTYSTTIYPNSTYSELEQTNADCSIYKAYLIQTGYAYIHSAKANYLQIHKELANQPMTLQGPSGARMESNGYLPEGFSINLSGYNSGALTSSVPSMLNGGYSGGEYMYITDVTDFVKSEGYGKYYGINIPYQNMTTANDLAVGWTLMVFEKDTSLEDIRTGKIALGGVYPGDTTVDLDFNGFNAPTDVTGEIMMIASDVHVAPVTNGGKGLGTAGTCLKLSYRPDLTAPFYALGENVPDTTHVTRPAGAFGQGLYTKHGKKLTTAESSGYNGLGWQQDVMLIDVGNAENTLWASQESANNGYISPGSSGVSIKMEQVDHIGILKMGGAFCDLDTLIFDTSIAHEDTASPPNVGLDPMLTNSTVVITGTAENTQSNTQIMAKNTRVKIQVSPLLSGITNMTATYKNYNNTTNTYGPDVTVTGVWDSVNNIVTFDFGEGADIINDYKDQLVYRFEATTDSDETLSNPGVNYSNTVTVECEDIRLMTTAVPLGYRDMEVGEENEVLVWATDEDGFDTKDAPAGTISGIVHLWPGHDYNIDEMDRLVGYTVKVVDSLGNVVNDTNGNALTTTTDATGYYKFEDVPSGNYYIIGTIPDKVMLADPDTMCDGWTAPPFHHFENQTATEGSGTFEGQAVIDMTGYAGDTVENRDIDYVMEPQIEKTARVSTDNGVTWKSWNPGTAATPVSVSPGDVIEYKITGWVDYSGVAAYGVTEQIDNTPRSYMIKDTMPTGLTYLGNTATSNTNISISTMGTALDAEGTVTTPSYTYNGMQLMPGTTYAYGYWISYQMEVPSTASDGDLYVNAANAGYSGEAGAYYEGVNIHTSDVHTYHEVTENAVISVKKNITNYNASLAGDKFQINLASQGTKIGMVSLKHGETSGEMELEVSGDSMDIDISEIVPMEYDKNYTVTLENKTGSTATVSGRKVTIHPGDEVTIVVNNTFSHTGYFKSKDSVDNIFTNP